MIKTNQVLLSLIKRNLYIPKEISKAQIAFSNKKDKLNSVGIGLLPS